MAPETSVLRGGRFICVVDPSLAGYSFSGVPG